MVAKRHEVILLLLLPFCFAADDNDERVKEPTLCEVCKFLTIELKGRLQETGRSKEVIGTGHGLDDKNKKKIKYHTSELRFIEALQEPHVCDKILEYNIHAEKEGSNRYAKGKSETMKTLHGLVDKGVKVVMDTPYEMWDMPSAEVTMMQRKCYSIVEDYEDDLSEWYFHHQDQDLTEFFCVNKILKNKDKNCLDEGKSSKQDKKKKSKDKMKGDTGNEDEPPKAVVSDDSHDEL